MVKYIVIDVDGTLTDGGIYYDDLDNEMKKFCTKDGTGIVCARTVGIQILVLTGRECAATTRRMAELHVDYIVQDVKNKAAWLKNWMRENRIGKNSVGYIGDDINDIGPMKLCGFIGCPADAAVEVKKIADYISTNAGGHGAVRDIIEYYLKEIGVWSEAVNKAYGTGV